MDYEVLKSSVSFFYTQGVVDCLGYELKIKLDTITALREGETAARVIFDKIIEMVKGEKVYAGMFIDNIDFHPRERQYKEGEIKTATKTNCILQEDGYINGVSVLNIVLARFTY